jgi:hypothetical protein
MGVPYGGTTQVAGFGDLEPKLVAVASGKLKDSTDPVQSIGY